MAADSRRWFVALLVAATLLQASTAVARPMASYRALDIGMPASSLGLLAAAFAIAPVVFALSIGRLIDRYGEARFLLGASVMLSVASCGLAFVGSALGLLVLLAALGLAQLVFVVANQTAVSNRTAADDYEGQFGHLSFVASLGQLIGPAAAGLIAGSGSPEGTSQALLFGAALALLALPIGFTMRRIDRRPAPTAASQSVPGPTVLQILRQPGMRAAMLTSMTVVSAMDLLVVYLPALGEERGVSPATIGALLAVRAGSSMASRFLLGRLIRWLGRDRLLIGSLVVAAVAVISLAFLPLPAMFAAMVVAGWTLGVCQPMTMSWVAARATPGSRGTAMSVRLLGNRVAQVAIPLAAGAVGAVTGTVGVLATAGVSVAISAAVAVRGRGRG
jgi:predicted MFS family arabinose efflux permease